MARVALFEPCYLSALRPQDSDYARRVIEALGDVVTPIAGRCCGQPAYNSGFRSEARTVGRQLLKVAQPHAVTVVPSGSCTSMVRHYLPALFEERSIGAQSIANRFVDFASYVANHPKLSTVSFRLEGTVSYHDSCHTRRELHATGAVIQLLSRIEGLEVRRLANEDDCCGFGGAFSAKLPEVSVAMMTSKLEDVSVAGARVLVSTDYSCLAHLEAGARGVGMQVQGWTLAELLARALP